MPTIPRILIVDDEVDHRAILIYQLTKFGPFEIRETKDGQQALTILAAEPPDPIFMNLGFPRVDGWEAIRRIHALAAPLGQLPILAFTAYRAGGWKEQNARQAGCDTYLVKPVMDQTVLQQTVTSLLTRNQRP